MGVVERIILTRLVVTVEEDVGFLPGSLEDKLRPYTQPLFDNFAEFLSFSEIEDLIEEKKIEIATLGFYERVHI